MLKFKMLMRLRAGIEVQAVPRISGNCISGLSRNIAEML